MKKGIKQNTIKKSIKVLIAVLTLFLFNIGIVKAEPITITYDVDGGSEVSATVIEEGTRIGALPTTTKVGYALEGWYLDSEFNTRVSESTIATTNTELHAKWVVNGFPTVFKQDEATFDGTNILRTGIRLYNTANWEKDYEIGFTITEYVPSVQTGTQATFLNVKYEVESLNWPGLVIRRVSKKDSTPERITISQNINGTKQEALQTNITVPIQVKILRIDKKVYYEYKGGTRTLLQDMSSFNQQFDTEVTFGASLDENNEMMRPFIGKISNMYIKMGKYQENTLTDLQVENETVTPTFNNSIFDYKTVVDKDTESVNVIATPGTDTIDVTNDGVHELHSGKNQIDIITTSSNGSIGVYTLEVLRNTTIPTDADCLNVTYNKSEQTLIPDSTLYDWVGGSNKQTNAGTYTLTARLKDGNIWSDGTTKDKTVTCSMNKATPTITVDKEITTIVEGKTDKFNVKASENGKFSTNFNPAGIAAAMQETTDEVQANTDTKITLAGTKDGTTTFTILFTPTDITNYETVEKTINLTVEDNPYLVPVDNTYGYKGEYETFTAPYTGFYQVQLWGTQGGKTSSSSGGKGAYTSGTIKLTRGDTLYVYVGQFVNGTSNVFGFNGGGRGSYSSAGNDEYNGNGGGATDIRLVSGSWDDESSLASRIMVAAGGGGANKWGDRAANGGAGGALAGLNGGITYDSSHGSLVAAKGGTQISGGLGAGNNTDRAGSFGKGGSNSTYTQEWSYYAGGGGGYYGGGAGGSGTGIVSSAAGGSSYISGYTGSVAIKSASDITPKEGCTDGTTNIECSYHYSGKIFTSPVMIAGNASMPNVAGTGNETGHAGVGAAKITLSVKEPYVNDLEVENYPFEEIFDESRENYKVIVDKDETSIKINIDTTENVASVVGDGTHQLTDGENKIDVTVTGNDGLVIVYQIEVVKNVIIPIDADCADLTYNKNEQTLIADDTAYDWVSGANKQTSAGTYTLTARLKSGYTWADKTTDDKTVTCSMKKLTPVITLDKEINNLGVLDPDTFNEQASENGKFSSTVSTKGIVSITHDSKDEIQANTNNKVTITGAKAGSTTVTITFTPTDTNNMEIVQKSFDVTVSGEVTPDPTEEEFITINPSSNPNAFSQTYACRDDRSKVAKPTPAYETFTAPKDGYYKFELWGAQGGVGARDGSVRAGGKGAYTKAVRYLHQGDTFYVYVGCRGMHVWIKNTYDPTNEYGWGFNASEISTETKRKFTQPSTAYGYWIKKSGTLGGYNGGVRGGDDTNSDDDADAGGGGGGATDIRLVSGNFSNFDSLKSRVMVAGGGGGGSFQGTGGVGRGLENDTNSSGKLLWGQLGYSATSGSGGGGGGYFGGASERCDGCLGYGGTSYISGAEGANSISEASVVDNVVLTGAKTHYSGVAFEDTVVIPGNQVMPNTAGTGTMTGNSGNGYAKITEAGISYDATLKRLSLNGQYTDERLVSESGDQRFFDVTVNKYEVEATVDVEPNSPSATVTYQPNIKIHSGDSTRMITVTAEDGSVEIYQINIHRDPNDIDYLKDLTFNGQTVPGFDPDVLEYTVEIDPFDTETPNFEIGATKYSDEQEVTGLGSYTTRNGDRDYPVPVTSEDKTKTRTYIIHTHKAHTTKLKELELKNVTINPTFDKNVFEYNADIDPEDTYVNITKMIPWDSDATVVATGYSFIPTNRNGEITITVTAPEAEPSVYRIKIKRQNLPTDVKITTPEREYIVPFESEFNLGTNIKGKKGKSYTVTFNYQDDRENTVGTYSDGYNPNGWLINNVHYDNNATIIAIEDTVVSYDYSITGERIVLPEPEADDRTFSHWNSKSDGTGTHYTNESINKLSKNTTVYAIWDYEDVTIEFDSHGGSSVDSFTRKYKQEYGKLPTPTKEGYFFGGWFKEATYQNKVSAKTKATEDVTLHAQWIETNFPYVYPLHDSQYNCYGSVYIDTGIELYSQENWDKDYEIGFTIDEYNYSDQVSLATIVSDKYEVESLDYPGMAFRRSGDDFSKLEITQNQNGNKASIPLSYTLPLKVRIVRIDKVVYYSINDGELTLLQDMSNFNQQHDIPVYFCAADNGSGGVQRLAKAKISNYYIKAGDYYEEDQEHSVTYPDGTVKMYQHNTLLQLESNTGTKDDEVISTVTFKYHNGEEDTTSDVLKKYIPNGFDINNIHYDDEATLVVNEDKVIENSFDIEVVGAEFPEDPVKEGSEFSGWYTEETGGTKKTSYSGLTDITLHAQYDKETVIITTPEGEEEYPKGEEYTLGTNDITKDDATFDVTFKFHNGEEDFVNQVSTQYIPNGWLVNGVHYPDGGKFVVEDDTIISPDYIEINVPVEFPGDPEKEGHNFTGWYDSVTGGHEVTGYDRSEEFTLHAQWELKILDVTTPEGTEEVPYGTDYTLGTNNTPKESDAFDVTFKYHDNVTDDRVEHVGKDYTPHGWRVNGVYYPNGSTFTVVEDTVIEPNYKETILEGEWPSNPTNGDYMFVGWFDQEENGTKYESFEGLEVDTVLHARWREKITIITPDGPIIVPKGEEYELPTNNEDLDDEVLSTVTFKYYNDMDDTTSDVMVSFEKNGWLINGVHYDDKAIITPEEDIELIPDYIETIIPAEFPNDPEKQYNIFNGWFDQEEGGNKYTEYAEEHDITLHAQWTEETVHVTLPDKEFDIPKGTEVDVPPNYINKPAEIISTVHLHYNNNDDDDDMFVSKVYDPNGWEIDGEHYDAGDTYVFDHDVELIPIYTERIEGVTLPTDVEKEHYEFSNWYQNENFEGDPITSYMGEEDIDVYCKWIGEEVTVYKYTTTDEPKEIKMHYGDTYTFDDLDDSYLVKLGDVVFDFNDGVTPNNVQSQTATITNPYWFEYDSVAHQGKEYSTGDQITVTKDMEIYLDGDYEPSEIIIPDVPTKEHYVFVNWFNEDEYEIDPDDIWAPVTYTAKWRGEDITVHTPDGDITVEYGKEYDIPDNDHPKENTDEATVTFDPHNGEEVTIGVVQKQYAQIGWLVNGVHYDANSKVTYYEESTLEPEYDYVVIPVTFPSNPTKFRSDFTGWFTEETGGEEIDSYDKLEDTVIHAHWTKHIPDITTPEGIDHPDENDQYEFPVNNYPKDSENLGTVTFVLNNGENNIVRDIIKNYIPNGWTLNNEHYDSGSITTILDDCEIIPDYTSEITPIVFPSNPVKQNYTFIGWYTASHGGDKITEYNGEESITLYARYKETDPTAEEYILPSDQPDKPTETLATVTFKYHNGDPDTYGYVQKKYLINGWLVDGVYHHNGDVILKTDSTVIEPNYTEIIIGADYPDNPEKENSKFTGWYTEETGGEKVYVYSELQDITLHAQYTENYTMLKTGPELKQVLKYSILYASEERYQTALENGVSFTNIAMDGMEPVYYWRDSSEPTETSYYFYSNADVIFMNPNSSYFLSNDREHIYHVDFSKLNSIYVTDFSYLLFGNSGYLKELDISNLDTSNVTNMNYTFYLNNNNNITSFDLSTLNTHKVEDFSYFISGKNITSLNIGNLDTRSAINMSGMFRQLGVSTLDLSSFDTSHVENFGSMFAYDRNLSSLDVSNFDTRNATYIGGMFMYCDSLENINVSGFDTSNVENMQSMFSNMANIKEIDISSFTTKEKVYIRDMFSNSPKLKTIYVSDKWNPDNVYSPDTVFYESTNIVGQKGTTYSYARSGKKFARVDNAPEDPGLLTNKYPNTYTITYPDDTTEKVKDGDEFTIPTNNYPKDDEVLYSVIFDPQNGEEVITSSTVKKYMEDGYTINGTVYHTGDVIRITGDITLVPNYIEVIEKAKFPDDPTKTGFDFIGWFTEEEGGEEVTSLDNVEDGTTLYAHYENSLPTDMELDLDDITIVVGETHQIEVTFTPDGSHDTLTYNDFDKDVISLTEEGLITGLEAGETTITIGTENTDIEKTINVIVLDNKITSKILSVEDRNLGRIIIGENPETNINDFLDKIDNPKEYLVVYDKDGNQIEKDEFDSTIVTTGMKVKLVIGNTEYDEVIAIIRGDIDQDGYVDISDSVTQLNHILYIELINDYRLYAADVDIDEEAEEDEMIDISDNVKLDKFILGEINNINE